MYHVCLTFIRDLLIYWAVIANVFYMIYLSDIDRYLLQLCNKASVRFITCKIILSQFYITVLTCMISLSQLYNNWF